jgi:predicted Zn-dependent peptidase
MTGKSATCSTSSGADPAATPVVVDRSRLPEPGRAAAFVFPDIDKSTMPNGLRVWTVRHPAIPVVTLRLLVKRGSATDVAGKAGLAALTVDMLDEGSGGRSAIEMHEALARIGAQLDSDIGPDTTVMTITTLSRFARTAVAILGDMIARPSLTDGDFARVRQLRLHRLTQLRDVPAAVADRTFARLLYGDHPYGHSPLGTERALASMTIDEVRTFHSSVLRPSEATLVVAGDCDHGSISKYVEEAFDDWRGTAAADSPPASVSTQPPRLNVIPRPGASQSELRLGHVAVARSTPDYHALVAANTVLGGQFVSRINLNLREDKGLTYGARTSFDFRRLPGPFALHVSVQTTGTARAIAESLNEIEAIRGPRAVTSEELKMGVAALTRGYARNFETAEQIARAVTQIAAYDLPDSYYTDFIPRIERLTEDEVTHAIARHIHPDRLTALVVGDLDVITDDLAQLRLGPVVVVSTDSF